MSNDMLALGSSKLPTYLQKNTKVENPFAAAVGSGGFPVVSIRGKVFHVQRGDERTLVTKPNDEDPASSLEVVILATNPNKSKVFYAHGYEEGSADKPDCYSNDGVAPAADAENPQAKKCATCPHNQWGSRITENGAKGKACADSMRLAIAPAGQINDPMLLRVPAASLKTLGAYGSQLAKRGVAPQHVVTKIGFDHSVAYPSLTFKAVRFVDEEEYAAMEQVLADEEEVISNITGASGAPSTDTEAMAEDQSAGAAKPKKPAEGEGPASKPKPKPKPVKKPEPEPEPEPDAAASVEDYDSIDDALDNLDFDD